MRPTLPLAFAVVLALVLAGCSVPSPAPTDDANEGTDGSNARAYTYVGDDWPDLRGVTLTILDHGAFGAFDGAKAAFENLTGATVEHIAADDAGSALNQAIREKGDPTFDVIYGIDNILWTKAVSEGIFEPYKPVLWERVAPEHVFFATSEVATWNGTWYATPVDHGYIGLNVDEARLGANVTSLDDVLENAATFVTEDPRTSTPGLGFLLATIATYGEDSEDGWTAYWSDLFEGGVLVTSGWTEAYVQHFSAGYGIYEGGAADKAIVTSYTTSPAYEAFFGSESPAAELVAPESTFHQIETMGIVKGTKDLAAAQAWIEFTLTDAFQDLMAPGNAVYPIVATVETDSTFGEHDPEPGTFVPATYTAEELGANVERWIREWTDLCEQHECA